METLGMVQAERDAHEHLRAAAGTGKWLAAVFHIDEAGVLHVTRTTHGLPVQDYREVVALLHKNLTEAVMGPTPTPLPVASLGAPALREAVGLEEALDRQ